VATDLTLSLPNLKNFVTLSPVPGLKRWMREEAEADEADEERRKLLLRLIAANTYEELDNEGQALAALAAEYLVRAKRQDGLPLDPVARFHFGNGASLERIHPFADVSPKGIAQSCGVMVNYRYDLNTVEANHELFAHKGEIVTTRAIRSMLGPEAPKRNTRRLEHVQRAL
jgi:malonyl-CoA decarboxylase